MAYSTRLLLAMCAAVATLSGCLEDLPQAEEITGLRILGIRAQPPEVAPGDSVTVEALIADPLNRPRTLTWHACLRPDRSTGFFQASGAGAAGGKGFGLEDPGTCTEIAATNPDVIPLGGGNPVRLNIPEDLLDDNDLIAAYYGIGGDSLPPELYEVLKSIAGINMTVSLVVEVDGDRREAFKRVNVSTNSDKNQNPTEIAFHLTDDTTKNPPPETAEAPPARKCFLGDVKDVPLPVPPTKLRLTPLNIPEDQHVYKVILGSADPDQPLGIQDKEEVYFYSFFSEVGGFGDRTIKSTSSNPVGVWDLTDHAGKDLNIWIIARDGRGGTGWCHSPLKVLDAVP